ncbi:MAG: amidase [Myxococcales bacterium]|nr:amidase [Myxococcales bacterium]
MRLNEYTNLDAVALAAHVAKGDVTPLELVDAAISAIERVEPRLNAVVHRMFDQARALAGATLPAGPLRGVPMVVKDFDGFVQGAPFTAGSRFLVDFVPQHDAEAIARLRRAGLVFLAKTNCPELGLLGTTEPELHGPTRNPYELTRSTGGSSGGSAALVAARAVPVGHGGDGGGSLRIPANHCGLVGLKASRGRVPAGPEAGEGWGGYAQRGVMTRTVRDTATLMDALAGPMPGDPYAAPPLPGPLTNEVGRDPGRLRVAFFDGSLLGNTIDPEHRSAVQETAKQLESLGHHVEDARPDVDGPTLANAYFTQIATSTAIEVDDFAKRVGRTPRGPDFEPTTWFTILLGRALTGLELQRARETAHAAARVMGAFHSRFDLFLTATVTHPQAAIGQMAGGLADRAGAPLLRALPSGRLLRRLYAQRAPELLELTPNTQLFNQTGQPAISLPLHMSKDGLPIGIQLCSALGREDLLVRVASQLETAHPWHARRPRVCA